LGFKNLSGRRLYFSSISQLTASKAVWKLKFFAECRGRDSKKREGGGVREGVAQACKKALTAQCGHDHVGAGHTLAELIK
jgi:hypothetical protein